MRWTRIRHWPRCSTCPRPHRDPPPRRSTLDPPPRLPGVDAQGRFPPIDGQGRLLRTSCEMSRHSRCTSRLGKKTRSWPSSSTWASGVPPAPIGCRLAHEPAALDQVPHCHVLDPEPAARLGDAQAPVARREAVAVDGVDEELAVLAPIRLGREPEGMPTSSSQSYSKQR